MKHIAQKDEMIKIVTDEINKICEQKIQKVDEVYDSACQSLSTQSERISNYLENVEKSLQRTSGVLKNPKLKELLVVPNVITNDIRNLKKERPQDLTTFQVKFTDQKSCVKKRSFYTVFQELADKSKCLNVRTHYT